MPYNLHEDDASSGKQALALNELDELDPVIELADSVRGLIDKFDQIRQILDIHENKLLKTDPEFQPCNPQPNLKTLQQWQNFIDRVVMELDTLTPPI